MKTSKEDFKIFKDEFIKWQKRFGLQGYNVSFKHKRDDENYATCTVYERSKKAVVVLAKYLREKDMIDYDPKALGKHEVLHLLLHRLLWLGQQRYTNSGEMDQEWEKLVVILEKIL